VEASGEMVVVDEGIGGALMDSIGTVLKSDDPRDDERDQDSAQRQGVQSSSDEPPEEIVGPKVIEIGNECTALELLVEETGERREHSRFHGEEDSL
jgi:hypothetical protein